MDRPRVSIIIPVYKVEDYLRRCVDSAINQSYKNIEVVLVDDGSPDSCPKICDDYAVEDQRIRVIHKNNGGLSSARNAGLDYGLEGEYVTFLDGDDWLENDTIEYCINLIDTYNVDVVQYQCHETPVYITNVKQAKEKITVFEGKSILEKYLLDEAYSVCMSLFRRDLFKGLRFREGKINEDIDIKYKVLQKSNRMAYSNQKKYYYFQTGNSISMGGLKKKDFDLYDSADELYKLTEPEEYGNIRFLGRVKKSRTAFSLLCKIAYYGIADSSIDKKEVVRQLTKEHRANTRLLLKSSMPFSRKTLAVLFFINYSLAEAIIRIMRPFLIY